MLNREEVRVLADAVREFQEHLSAAAELAERFQFTDEDDPRLYADMGRVREGVSRVDEVIQDMVTLEVDLHEFTESPQFETA